MPAGFEDFLLVIKVEVIVWGKNTAFNYLMQNSCSHPTLFAVKAPSSFVPWLLYCSVRTKPWHQPQAKSKSLMRLSLFHAGVGPSCLHIPFSFSPWLPVACSALHFYFYCDCSQLLLLLLLIPLQISSWLVSGVTYTGATCQSRSSHDATMLQPLALGAMSMVPTTGASFQPSRAPHHLSLQALETCQRRGIFTTFVSQERSPCV